MPATAQEAAVDNVAFLVEQPARGSALPVLPANTLDYIAARYDLAGASVDVYVVPTPQVTAARTAAPPDDTVEAWQALACAGAPLEVWSASADTRPLSRTPRQGYTLYIAGPADDAARCSFAAGFAGTFEFFLAELDRSLTQGVPPEFPAVVTLD